MKMANLVKDVYHCKIFYSRWWEWWHQQTVAKMFYKLGVFLLKSKDWPMTKTMMVCGKLAKDVYYSRWWKSWKQN